MGSLAGRVALVTGASRGIGAALAERLGAEGASVAVTARSLDAHPHLPGTLRGTVAAVERHGSRALAIAADLADPASRRRIVAEAEAGLGPIDVLVNNAAAAFYLPFLDLTEKRFRVAFELNVRAPFELAQLVLPGMRARRRGWILNISSATAAHSHGPPYDAFAQHGGALVYGMSKAALDRFSTGLAGECAADGISVNSLSPVAAVATPGVLALGMLPEGRPDLIEPVELMVEAALALCEGNLTGRVAFSRPLLAELRRPVRGLDGRPR